MLITALSESHAPQYKAVMLHAYEHAADAFTSTPEERAAEPDSWWVSRLANPAGLTVAFGALEGQDLAGVLTLEYSAKPKTKHKSLLVGMYVLPPWRGKGIARALMHAAIEHASQRGNVTVVQLEVTLGNEAAIKLYESLGFKQFGVEPMAVLTPTGYRSKVHMWRQVGKAGNAA